LNDGNKLLLVEIHTRVQLTLNLIMACRIKYYLSF